MKKDFVESDIINVCNMSFFGHHGLRFERKIGSQYQVDVKIYTSTRAAGKKDNIKRTIDYREIYIVVKEIIEQNSYRLIETIAERIADKILSSYAIHAVEVAVRKLHPPLHGIVDYVEVIIHRKKQ